ncbi:Sugar kinase of the NBD/HSP70 family, may contain an N-terminal HTH domain [Devosia lucknowensis]|uniref:Sugar kinase of the NBD/HSP70 family, may contain an N-terminal HTH domain n=1 Tax=Devosia lucknowensis TaxID=1096929 RepID=A0A1Y6EGB4_9HYPH|nr:ROK family transcriptional regulator [Devosia lucknowensis]SMQ59193.1 Sugar kinase of the NBD/HSP70 family, may contain an N-terminal HTH domain [Devosia lucknowensis]
MRKESVEDVFEPIVRGITQTGVRLANERAVLTLIAGIPGVSNADIARRSGLGPQTTARILSELEARDLIIRGDVLRGKRGQPATPYQLNPLSAHAIGVEIGWQHFEVLLQNMVGEPVAVTRRSYAYPDPDTVFAAIAADVETMLSALTEQQRERLAGIGVTSPGNFGPLLRHLGASDQIIADWAEVDIAARVERATGLPTMWVNDGSAAVWSEIMAQPAPRPKAVAAFFVGTFVGGGVVSGGSLVEGPYGNAADLGAVMVRGMGGQPAYLHLEASLHALAQRVRQAGGPVLEGAARKWSWDDIEHVVAHWLDDAGHALAQAVLTTTAMAEIDLATVNGDLPESILKRLLDSTRRHLDSLPVLLSNRPRLAHGLGGPSAAVFGAAKLLLFRRYFSRAWDLFEAEPAK